ncbi:pyridoxamine 5'-phosphate oxidase family protein [Desertimonas flava]|uniref:pyridoxamine 5'-phosphate oxidase family protein n=1 Tax=Desertimonas flava TaxID=2064846 RepID=UPI000E354BE8|nr:pyridoxamine 5'-phosphate oxidase family protein [Desertimonas flava]
MQTWLVELSPSECADLLEKGPIGRLGVVIDGRPEIFPISHVYDRTTGRVVFPTNDRTKLRAALTWPYVAYEVDGLEDGGGWSVMVVGSAELVDDVAAIERIAPARTVAWAAGPAVSWVAIVPDKVTGRRITAVDC